MKTWNWKTTLAGLGAVFTAAGLWLTPTFDGDSATEPNYAIIVPTLITGVGLIFAKDANKPS